MRAFASQNLAYIFSGWLCVTTFRNDAKHVSVLQLLVVGGGASAVKEPDHFEIRKSSSQVTRMHFFPQKKLTTFLFSCRPQNRPQTPFQRQNKTNKAVRYGNIAIFCSHYYRSKAIRRARHGGARAWVGAVDLPGHGAPWCSAATACGI